MWKELIVALGISCSAVSANAQTGAEIKLALDAAHFTHRVMQAMDEAQNRDERLQKLEEIGASIDDLIASTQQIGVLENLVRYQGLQRRANANHSRLKSYLRECQEPDDFCSRELSNLINQVREVSAEVRTLEPNPISIPMVAQSQETELFLADFSASASWRKMIQSDYENYWDTVVNPEQSSSLAYKLSALEQEQWEAINHAYGRTYHTEGVATAEEFENLISWINGGAIHNIQIPGRLGCIILQNPGIFSPNGEVSSVAPGYPTNFIFNYVTANSGDSQISAPFSEVGNGPHPSIKFEFHSEAIRRKYTAADRDKYSKSYDGKTNCVSYYSFKKGFQKRAKGEVEHHFDLISKSINAPVIDILRYRSLIEIGEFSKARLYSAS